MTEHVPQRPPRDLDVVQRAAAHLRLLLDGLAAEHYPVLIGAPGHRASCPALADPDADCIGYDGEALHLPDSATICSTSTWARDPGCASCRDGEEESLAWPCATALLISRLNAIWLDLHNGLCAVLPEETTG